MRTCIALIVAAALALAVGCGGSQAKTPVAGVNKVAPVPEAPRDAELDRVLGLDPRLRHGKLANGLTYYVLEHKKPQKRAQLWLGVNAGSIQEDDDQQGLAHFVEHMAFNGTKNYEKQAIVDYLESIGMKFGPDLNAYTSFDQTVYQLQVPTDDPKFVDKGFSILHEWAQDIAFDGVEVDKERGVVTEEWRLGRGAWKRIADKQYPVLFKGSRYAIRLPIGKVRILKNAPRAALVRFYKDWYRPDMMAIVAVGDFDGAKIEAQIKQMFGDLKNPATPRPRVAAPVPGHKQTLVTIETDPEMTMTTVGINNKLPSRPQGTVGDYRRFIAEQLYHSMLNARLSELGQAPDAPFTMAFSSTQMLTRTADAFTRRAFVKQGRVTEALTVLADEVARVDRHGFTKTELARAKKSVLRNYQRLVLERGKTHGRNYASEILRNFFTGEPMPGIEAELKIVNRYLKRFTLADLNQLAKAWGGTANRVISVAGPAKMKKPGSAQLVAIVEGTARKKLASYKDDVVDQPLMATKPKPGTITGEKSLPEIGVTEWTLSNGVKVVIKPTAFKNDEVVVAAESPGGHSLASDADFLHATRAGAVVSAGGVGPFDAVQLRKYLAGKVAYASAYIGELSEGISGRASPRDLETLMQLIHLRFTAPRRDEKAFAAWQSKTREWVRDRRLRPETAFFEDAFSQFTMNHMRRRPLTVDGINRVDLDKAMALYKQRFSDASDFTFTIVGNVDLEKLKPLVTMYLASLPSTRRKETWRDVKVRHPKGIKKFSLRRGMEPKSYVYLAFHGPQRWSQDAANDMQMLGEVLQIRLREVMREDMGGVYFVSPNGYISRRPTQRRTLSFFFPCDPKNVDKLTAAIFKELAQLKAKGIGAKYIAKIKQIRTRRHEVQVKKNGYWSRELAAAYRFGEDPRKITEFAKWTDKVSSKRVRAAARRFGKTNQYFLGVLYPAKNVKNGNRK